MTADRETTKVRPAMRLADPEITRVRPAFQPVDAETTKLRPALAPATPAPHVAGPFAPDTAKSEGMGLLGTGLLVMYPVVATIVIVISGAMLAGSTLVG